MDVRELSADGESVVGDVRLPFAWEATEGRLALVNPSDGKEVVVADIARNSRHLVAGSVGSGAVTASVLSEVKFLSGEDATGALVVLGPETAPGGEVLTAILDRGGLGFVTDFGGDRYRRADTVPEVRGATENGNVSADRETRDFIGFVLAPRVCDKLRLLSDAGSLTARVTCVARRFAGPVPDDPVLRTRMAATWEGCRRGGSPCGDGGSPCGRRDGVWRAYAAGIVLTLTSPVVPCDLVRLPRHRRMRLARPFPENPLAEVAARADGRTDLATLFAEVERAHGKTFDEPAIRRGVLFLCLLAEYGYLGCTNAGAVTRERIVGALRAVGVEEGDVLMVHSSLSALGYVPGGAETVLAALREAVGEKGTVLLPAFSSSLRVFNVVNRLWAFRPFDRTNAEAVRWVGELPAAFLRTHPGAPHSGHCTTAWTGFGPRAAELTAGHPTDDEPFSVRSPFAKALAADAKAVFLGADVKSCSFIHYLEDRADAPGIGPALASAKGPDGRPRDVVFRRHAPGPREFYAKGEESRLFREAKAAGLVIRRAPLGLGQVKSLRLADLAATCRFRPDGGRASPDHLMS